MKILFCCCLFVLFLLSFFFFLTLCRLTAPKIPEGEKVDFDVSIPETGCVCLSVPEPYTRVQTHITPPVLDTAEDKVKDKSMDALLPVFSERLLSAP